MEAPATRSTSSLYSQTSMYNGSHGPFFRAPMATQRSRLVGGTSQDSAIFICSVRLPQQDIVLFKKAQTKPCAPPSHPQTVVSCLYRKPTLSPVRKPRSRGARFSYGGNRTWALMLWSWNFSTKRKAVTLFKTLTPARLE